MQRIPTIATLEKELRLDDASAVAVRTALQASDPATAATEGGFCGVESIVWPDRSQPYYRAPRAELEYLNAGDPYAATLCRVTRSGHPGPWYVASSGDVLERLERRYGQPGRWS